MGHFFSMLSDVYTNIAGPAAIVMAVITYTDWGRRLLANKHWISAGIVIVMGLLLVADIAFRHPTWFYPKLETVVNKKISNQVVVLDGYDYENCEFQNVTFEYNG